MSNESSSSRATQKMFPNDTEVIDTVFITPRVLDQGAFREYADSLKGLIREAGGRRTELRTDAEEARQLRENLSEAADRLRERLETTAKLLPALDNRVRRAEEVMARVEDEADLPAQLEERIGRRVAEMEARVQQTLAAAEERLAALGARYDDLQRKVEKDMERLDGVRGDLDRSAARAEERVVAVESRVARAEEVAGALRLRVEGAIETIDAHATEALKRARAVEMLCDRAVRLLGFDPDEPSDEVAPDSLMMLVQRGDQLERAARATAEELAALHKANAEMMSRFEATARGSGESIERLTARRGELEALIEGSLATLREAPGDFLERVVEAREQLAEIERRRDQVDIGMGGMWEELVALEAGMAERLGRLRTEAAEELGRLERAALAHRRGLS